jgi:hypothetical protein
MALRTGYREEYFNLRVISRIIKSGKMISALHVTRMGEMRNAH